MFLRIGIAETKTDHLERNTGEASAKATGNIYECFLVQELLLFNSFQFIKQPLQINLPVCFFIITVCFALALSLKIFIDL